MLKCLPSIAAYVELFRASWHSELAVLDAGILCGVAGASSCSLFSCEIRKVVGGVELLM